MTYEALYQNILVMCHKNFTLKLSTYGNQIFFNANISNSYIVWTYTYTRKNVISSKLTEAVRRNFKKIRNFDF